MVTISPIRTKHTFFASIRGKILLAFFVIVGVSFAVAATNLTGLVSDYLYEQRSREDSLMTEKAAAAAEPYFESLSTEELNRVLEENANGMDGRLLLIDADGKVQFDTFGTLCGQRLQLEEVLRVLYGTEEASYGMYTPGRETVEQMSGVKGADYVAYSTRAVNGPDGRRGTILFVSRVQDMMDSLGNVRMQLNGVFIIIAVGALILALFLSQILTNPITALSRTMRKMGKGDLSVRVPVKGSGELRELAENYNTMAAQLESLDKTRSQFVSNASHELKTPLATMKIALENLIYNPEMPRDLQQDFMEDMNHEIDRLTGIITDLLTLTKMDNQSDGESRKEEVNMSELTEETIRLLTPAAEKRGQTLEVHAEKGLYLTGDRIRLNQILYNLTDNAIKYTPDKGRIRVTLRREDDELVWRVKDNGVGIPAEDQEHIFERFYRVDKARSRETGGTGLGLSIVRQMVNLQGGSVSVESTQGKGSEFIVRFPLEEEDE